jgi:outer membrane protein assembly factor BamE (lipoprotein component of BamABCDE complex)
VHGVSFLEKKQEDLIVKNSNKNDIIKILGPPSTNSTFDKDLWIYIERKTSSSKVTKLGKKKLLVNNVLILELDNKGILTTKIFLDKDQMQDIKFSKELTGLSFSNKSFVRSLLSSVREKINDPLGKKRRKIKSN